MVGWSGTKLCGREGRTSGSRATLEIGRETGRETGREILVGVEKPNGPTLLGHHGGAVASLHHIVEGLGVVLRLEPHDLIHAVITALAGRARVVPV